MKYSPVVEIFTVRATALGRASESFHVAAVVDRRAVLAAAAASGCSASATAGRIPVAARSGGRWPAVRLLLCHS